MYCYHIDRADRLTYLSPEWRAFARANGAPELTEAAVIGRSLWDYIADVSCSAVYRSLLASVRAGKSPMTIPFRCDSPTLKRFMELKIELLADAELRFCGKLIREEERPYRAVLDPAAKRSAGWVHVCAWCRRVEGPRKRWLEIDRAVRRLSLFSGDAVPNVSHGICPRCARQFRDIGSS